MTENIKPKGGIVHYVGYIALVFCWTDFGVLLKALAGLAIEWNLSDNLLALLCICAIWQLDFIFTLPAARVENQNWERRDGKP